MNTCGNIFDTSFNLRRLICPDGKSTQFDILEQLYYFLKQNNLDPNLLEHFDYVMYEYEENKAPITKRKVFISNNFFISLTPLLQDNQILYNLIRDFINSQ
jgi:hypothetical protein